MSAWHILGWVWIGASCAFTAAAFWRWLGASTPDAERWPHRDA